MFSGSGNGNELRGRLGNSIPEAAKKNKTVVKRGREGGRKITGN